MYIYNVAKSLGFSFGQKKEKAKSKALASCADGNEKFPYYRTTLSSSVGRNLKIRMGQYFKIVNESKKKYISISDLGENNKFGYVGQGLNGIALGRLLASTGTDWDKGFYKEYGNPEKDLLFIGAWAGDKIVITGDYDLPNTNRMTTSNSEEPNRNLYWKVDEEDEEYEDITNKVITWLARNLQTSEMLAERAKRDMDLFKKLADLVFVNESQQMKESLENIIGKNWTKLLKK